MIDHDATDRFAPVLSSVAAGKPVVLFGGASGNGYLAFAADAATTSVMAFTVRYTSGFLCVALPAAECDRLGLPPMHPSNVPSRRSAYTVSVDARHGVSTGISAADRTRTVRRLAAQTSVEADFTRPGHIQVVASAGRGNHLDAVVELMVAAGRRPAAVFGALVSPVDAVRLATVEESLAFAEQNDVEIMSLVEFGLSLAD